MFDSKFILILIIMDLNYPANQFNIKYRNFELFRLKDKETHRQ